MRWPISALNRILHATPARGSTKYFSPSVSATLLRAPSAPKTYFARTVYSRWVMRSRRVQRESPLSRISSMLTSCVEKRNWNPLPEAYRTRIGSRYDCGRSRYWHGVARAKSPCYCQSASLISPVDGSTGNPTMLFGCAPHACTLPYSSPTMLRTQRKDWNISP